ncbi:MAG: extensin family protein [Alphaproteobacteria bacterium]|nr:extensin family protein [Alphaproteobacteria bacterium]
MRHAAPWLAALALSVGLAACSSGRRSAEFTLDGVQPPALNCPVPPSQFGQATPVPDFHEGNGCGVSQGYRVYAISEVGFSQPALITCDLANALNSWIASSVQPTAQAVYGQRIVGLTVAASYACRPRNNVSGSKLSEHGQGDAIDISGFTLADGREVNVLRDYYGSAADQRFLRTVRAQGCGVFHTVLGPGSDPYHRNHIHLDRQRERRGGGAYCH